MLDLDKDGNGVIDYSEFLTAAASRRTVLSQENLQRAFALIDADGNGEITIQELKMVF